jgi:formylglycine-generating enzyme required for sulfatase activity
VLEFPIRLNRKFVLISAGEFTMGSPANEVGHQDDETQHQVRLSSFYISKYELTVGEFMKFIEDSGYKTDAEKGDGSYVWNGKEWKKQAGINWRHGVSGSVRPQSEENHPVVHVSWNDAVAYCEWLSKTTGKRYRLPTEAEWEYACRAGTTTPFNTGSNLTTEQANYAGNYPYNNNAKGQYRQNTVPVESFAPNAWGLYNMHGNVWEWTDSLYDKPGSYRVLRGGSWYYFAEFCRSALRNLVTPDLRYDFVGFRLVFVP